MKMRMWHISNPPNSGFKKEVETVEEAKMWLSFLADYDLYLGDLIVCNVQGLEVFNEESKEWEEYEDEEGRDISEIMRGEDEDD